MKGYEWCKGCDIVLVHEGEECAVCARRREVGEDSSGMWVAGFLVSAGVALALCLAFLAGLR